MKKFQVNILILCLLLGNYATALTGQDLDSLLNAEFGSDDPTYPTLFRSPTIANGHSVAMLPSRTLDWRIEHRFGELNSGVYELFGLDQANIHFSFEYGITDWLNAGFGRGTYEKTYDGFIKIRPLQQTGGSKVVPVSLVLQSGVYMNTLRFVGELPDYSFQQRLEYVQQIMLGRNFGDWLTLQLMPTYLHRNPNPSIPEQSDLFALGSGLSVRITNGLSINIEYFHLLNRDSSIGGSTLYNPLSIGFDLATGGHVFQLIFTNSTAMTEHGIIGNTTGNWLDGDIHFGFNISRVFQL